MKQYMGYQALHGAKKPHEIRELPLYEIEGTSFLVDVVNRELRQESNPSNRIALFDAKEESGISFFYYDRLTRNHYTGSTEVPLDIPDHVSLVIVPCLKELDPVGLARLHGLPENYYQHKGGKPEQLPQLRRKEKSTTIQQQI